MRKCYTAFLFQGYSPKELHCTHKYLGLQTEAAVNQIKSIINQHLTPRPLDLPTINFHIEKFFGPDNNIRVLTPSKAPIDLLRTLRADLDQFNPDTYDKYMPHITTKTLSQLYQPFWSYALIDSKLGYAIAEWKL